MESAASLHAPLIKELKELYQAEMNLIASLPDMDGAADSDTLYELLQEHLRQTRAKAQRLDRLFKILKKENAAGSDVVRVMKLSSGNAHGFVNQNGDGKMAAFSAFAVGCVLEAAYCAAQLTSPVA
jgi:ferritin-like metal-binding protein YciE